MNELAAYLAAYLRLKLATALPMKAASIGARYAASCSEGNPHPLDPVCAVVSNVVRFPTPHPQRLKKEGCVWGLETLSLKQFLKGPGGGGLGQKKEDFGLVEGVGGGGESGRGGDEDSKRIEKEEEENEVPVELTRDRRLEGAKEGAETKGLKHRHDAASQDWGRA